jgi:predicted nucleotidyltransferase
MLRTDTLEKTAAIRAAKRVAKFLRRFGARRVILYGSVVTDRYLPGHSDIDIFFEGIPRNKETLVTGKTLLAFPELPLDLRPSGYCEDQFRKEIERSGVAV